ncbi:MAG: hypothetical protein Q9219_007232 [cf. Caloplaca sp. 3 TL-2023]
MPARLSSMNLSDAATPQPSSSPGDATAKRKSGRVKHKPVLLQSDPNIPSTGGGKRKRAADLEEIDVDNSNGDESDDDESDGDPDEEELKEKRRKSRSKKPSSKPAAKKTKTTQPKSMSLPVRSAANGVKKPSKPRRPRPKPDTVMAEEGTGLFAEVFSQGHTVDAVAAEWITRYDQHNANAMCELVNFVLRCTGCDLEVNVHDIEDPDNAASKLEDLQDEYQAKKITDYPLISKAKTYSSFRSTITSFFSSLIQTAHAAGLLYSDLALIENIEVWVTTMSSSPLRPFRHTATVISLAMEGALSLVYSEVTDSIANTTRQKEGEQKHKKINKERVASLQNKVTEGERKLGLVDTMLENIFNAVYVHRYRDIDPKIRVECVTALGTWITAAPDKFFAPPYLRYLGWILSDVSAPTRAEVVKQLSKLYKRKEDIGRLRAFTERFMPRFVEMALRDAEPNIRAAAVELLDLVRETGLLEPDDIDNVGRLIFDSEPRVRKAVAGFFAENINDLFDSVVEELGGDEGIAEAVGEDDPEDFDVPRRSWLKFKCLAEVLQLYSSEGNEEGAKSELPKANAIIAGAEMDSRFSLAARAVYQGVREVKQWEVLAGYLLFDNSSAATNGHGSKSPEHLFKERCQLNEFEQMLLLEILSESVKQNLLEAADSETDKKGKKSKARVDEARQTQESIAVHLAGIIPQLLRRFGANPTAAAVVLRLEHVLNLDIFEELRQGSTTYASLLDDINKQFLSHVDQDVLAEASNAILHARGFEDLQEVTESKLQELWSDTINSLRTLAGARENGHGLDLTSLSNTVTRIANLASVSDCIAVFESEQRPASKKSTTTPGMVKAPTSILLDLIESGATDDPDFEDLPERNQLTTHSIKALLFYHMWLVRSIRSSLETNTLIPHLLPDPQSFASALFTTMSTRTGTDPVRLAAAGAYLDLHTLYASMRNIVDQSKPTNKHSKKPPTANTPITTPPPPPNRNPNNNINQQHPPDLSSLTMPPIPPTHQKLLLAIFAAAEKLHARLSHRTLLPAPPSDDADNENDTAITDAPEDPDSEPEDEDNDAVGHDKQTRSLLAEKQLCELAGKIVLAVLAGGVFVDGGEVVKGRVKRNEKGLGKNFREVLAFLGEKKPGRMVKKGGKGGKKDGGKEKAMKSREVVEVSSSSDSEDEEGEGEEEGGGELADDRIEDIDGDRDGGREESERVVAPGGEGDREDEILGD